MSTVSVMPTESFVSEPMLRRQSLTSSPSLLPAVPKLSALSGGVTRRFLANLTAFFRAQGRLPLMTVHKILRDAKSLLQSQPSLVNVELDCDDVLYVCGDLHGQFYDLLHILERVLQKAPCKNEQVLFNGDFVDRGHWGFETMLLLLCHKLLYPQHVHLNRGNHECEEVNRNYGFEAEVLAKYNARTFRLFQEVFNWLPVAHVVNNAVMIVHGGLPGRSDVYLEDIKHLERGFCPQKGSIMSDLLWADPMESRGSAHNPRGYSHLFGPDVTHRFLEQNNLLYVIRSHECVHAGFRLDHNDRVITVFSAPNYCDRYGNRGAVCVLHGDDISMPEFRRFEAAPHPVVVDANDDDHEKNKGRTARRRRNVSTSPLLFRRGLA